MISCCYKPCSDKEITVSHGRVEVKGCVPKCGLNSSKSPCLVNWNSSGEAVFHRQCWDDVLTAARSRKRKHGEQQMAAQEKRLIKDAAETAEFHDSTETIVKEGHRIAELILNAKHCVAFTGAGISTSAGIGDYRGKSGKWTEEDRASSVGKLENGETKDNDSSEDENEDTGVPYESLRPTYTHEALKKLIELGLLKHIISQNGDGLHGLSGVHEDNLSELHGNVFIEVCDRCGQRYHRPFYVLDDHASQYYELTDNGTTDIIKPKHAKQCKLCGLSHNTGRKCDKCKKGSLRDTIINFRDNLEENILDKATEHAGKSDVMLCLGSTLMVTPANELVMMGKHPLCLVICNRQTTDFDKVCLKIDRKQSTPFGSRVFGDCDVLMKEVMKVILSQDALRDWEKERTKRMLVYDQHRESVSMN